MAAASPPPETVRTRAPWGRLLAGVAIGLVSLAIVVRSVDPAAVADRLRAADLGWFVLALASAVLVALTKAARWRVLLFYGQQPRRAAAFRPIFEVLMIAQMVNILVPIRLGEVVRILLLNRLTETPKATILSTIVIEKLLDLIVLALLAVVVVPAAIGETAEAWPEFVRLGVSALGVLVLAAAGRWHRPALAWASAHVFPRLPDGPRQTLTRLTERALAAFEELSDARALWAIGGWSALVWLFSALSYYLLLWSLHISVPALAGLVLVATVQLSFVLPQAPGLIGLTSLVPIEVLHAFGVVDESTRVAFSVLAYLVIVGPPMVLGAFFLGQHAAWLWREGLRRVRR